MKHLSFNNPFIDLSNLSKESFDNLAEYNKNKIDEQLLKEIYNETMENEMENSKEDK